MSPGRLRELVRKEMKQMLRDPKMKRIIFAAPVIQLLVFGYAVNTDVRNAPTILVDQDNTPTSRALADALTASGNFAITQRSSRSGDIDRALDGGSARAGLLVSPGFERDLRAGPNPAVQVLIDGSRSNSAMKFPRALSLLLSKAPWRGLQHHLSRRRERSPRLRGG